MTVTYGLTVAVVMPDLELGLPDWRRRAADDDRLAWVVVRPTGGRDLLPAFARDLLQATGAVGLRQPRRNGERFLHRALAHLAGGGFSDVFVQDADLLGAELLEEVAVACHAIGVRVWLLMDGSPPTAVAEHLTMAGVPRWTFADVEDAWSRRLNAARVTAAACTNRLPWKHAARMWRGWVDGCPSHRTRVGCLLRAMRRDLTSGVVGADEARDVVMALPAHASTTVEDVWELSQVAQNLWTPTESALIQILPMAVPSGVDVGCLSRDASTFTARGLTTPVPDPLRPLLARQAAYSRLTHGPDDWPLLTLHDGSF